MSPGIGLMRARKQTLGTVAALAISAIAFAILFYLVLNRPTTSTSSATYFSWDSVGATPPPDGSICGNYVPEQVPDWNVVVSLPPLRPRGIAVSTLEGNLKTIGYRTYSIAVGQSVLSQFHIWYPRTQENDHALDLRLITLLDERQIPDSFMGTAPVEIKDYFDLTLSPGDNISIQIKLPPLSDGIHDLVILVLDNVNDQPDTRGQLAFTAMRFTLIAGTLNRSRELLYTPLTSAASRADPSGRLSLLLSLENTGPSTWNWPKSTLPIPVGQKQLTFYTWLGNLVLTNLSTNQIPAPHNQPVALLTFFNYHLVSKYLPNSTQYVMIPINSEYSTVENILDLPSDNGRYDILTARINYPGIPMCLLQGDRNGFGFPSDVDLQRVSITVD